MENLKSFVGVVAVGIFTGYVVIVDRVLPAIHAWIDALSVPFAR